MSYATAQQFADKYGLSVTTLLLASLEPGASTDPAVLEKLLGGDAPSGEAEEALARGLTRLVLALDDQSDMADTYLTQAVALPLEQATIDANPIAAYVCDLARYALATKPGVRHKQIEDDKADALAWFQRVGRGAAGLLGLPTGESTTQVAVNARAKTYTDDVWSKY